MKRFCVILIFIMAAAAFSPVFAQEAEADAPAAEADAGTAVWKYLAAALAVGISCIAGGIAVGQIGSAAMGAMSENPELSGKALPYAGLAEGICLWGFLVALLILVI
jgi:V/A-type H+-transporting ATPase subunit K